MNSCHSWSGTNDEKEWGGFYEKEKNFKACNIDKKIWSKIKMNNYNYHDFTFNEQSQLKRIPIATPNTRLTTSKMHIII